MSKNPEILLELGTYCTDVDDIYRQMSEGARCHMANKLYKEGYMAVKARAAIDELSREFEILDSACDFWKQEAIDRGYEE